MPGRRDDFLAHGQAGLMARAPDPREEENKRLKAKVGELTMHIELLDEKVGKLEAGLPPASRRPKR